MLLSHIKRLCTILPTLIVASPQDTTVTSLPAQLQRTVPGCAQPCLQSVLNDRFSRPCTGQDDISCLCSQYSDDGETLGEAALRCIYSSCPTIDQAPATYNICLGQKNAVRPTRTAITVGPTMASPSSSVTIKQSSTFTASIRLRPTSTNSVVIDSLPATISSATSSLLSTASPTTAPVVTGPAPGPKTMTPAQIAGLSVAAVATFIIAISLMALSVSLRRRRERKYTMEISDEKTQPTLPPTSSSQYSQLPPRSSSLWIPPAQFPMPSNASAQKSKENLQAAPMKPSTNKPAPKRVFPITTVYSSPPQVHSPDFSSVHPLLRPGAGLKKPGHPSVPSDQIGLAISAELPGKSVKVKPPQPPRKAELRQQRPKSFRRSVGMANRASSASILTQETVFEEDDLLARRRSSKLLPTPPVPIPPTKALQPSRPPPAFRPTEQLQQLSSTRQILQQPELFLNIPVRHSNTLLPRITPGGLSSGGSPQAKVEALLQLAPPIQITSATSTYDMNNAEDIDDYYFMAHQKPSKAATHRLSPGRMLQPKESPRNAVIKPKTSLSTVSRATSRASSNIRDSISSQTSFETIGTNDPTPDDEDDDKQLSDDNKLSPVAESPISNLRYPKVPRASNQLVPRSPRSPRSQQERDQFQTQPDGSPHSLPSPSALLIKRRGEKEALQLESQLHMGTSGRADVRNYMGQYRKHIRSTSGVDSWNSAPTVQSERSTRTQSGQWPRSPAMFDVDVVKPLNIRGKRESEGMQALKSPAWVPHLTPTRKGEDLLISVSYSR